MDDLEKQKIKEELKQLWPAILIVDNDESILDAMKTAYSTSEVVTFTATSGIEALRKIPLIKGLTLVLLDIVMPGIDGFETLEIYEEILRQVTDVPIVLMTASNTVVKRYDVLRKPFDIDDLFKIVSKFWMPIARGKLGKEI